MQRCSTADDAKPPTAIPWLNSVLYLAMLCEKLECWAQVLVYAEAARDRDHSKAGCQTPATRIIALALEGRAYAALGRLGDAARALDAAAEESHQHELWLLELFALRDLKLSVLDQMGHGEHGSRRLGVVIRLLTGPAKTLTPLLKGLDATELMSLPPPQPEYVVPYAPAPAPSREPGESATAELRKELMTLRMMVLQQRVAKCDSISASQLDDAMESDAPKFALIELLLEHHRATRPPVVQQTQELQEQLRAELSGLRMLALQDRASQEAIHADLVEDAMDSDRPKDALIALLLTSAASKVELVHAAEQEDPAVAELRRELEGMRTMALQTRATEIGVDSGQIEDAMDSDNPKCALVSVLMDHEASTASSVQRDQRDQEQLRAELLAMRVMALQKRAESDGVDPELIAEAMESKSPKMQ
eukprot:COSAG05_NODE_4522_length_1480_cov_1.152064_1_plen_419_part_01